ncbi:hypothetical protein BD626DRAFT_402016 [Schizophyllum amplum]|uniref:Uncharacterized protein n=1 Tax=Schizophyllum amplum TaxID=97359 RepID=A0A550CF04_9AGAR|nr:hypothetical protein BD626DRAFT_402016 [Auriculariopsis ampla]
MSGNNNGPASGPSGAHIPGSGVPTPGSGVTPQGPPPQGSGGGNAPGSGSGAPPQMPPVPPVPRIGPISGLQHPLPADFDFQAWMKVPAATPCEIPIKLRHKDNLAIEAHNASSIRQTILFMARKTAINDIGAELHVPYDYASTERDKIYSNKESTKIDWNTYPDFLQEDFSARKAAEELEKADKADAERQEKEARKLKAVPTAIAPTVFTSGPSALISDVDEVPIPSILLSHLACGVELDLTFYLNSALRLVADQNNIKTRTHVQHGTKETTLIDSQPTKAKLGLPDPNTLTIAEHDEASRNLLRAFILVCTPALGAGNETTIATQLFRHIEYFRKIRDRIGRFPIWRSLDRMLRMQIIKHKVAFDKDRYDAEVMALYRPIDLAESENPIDRYHAPAAHTSAPYPNTPAVASNSQDFNSSRNRDFEDRRRRFSDRRDNRDSRRDFDRHEPRRDFDRHEPRRDRDFGYDARRERDNGYRAQSPAPRQQRDEGDRFRGTKASSTICFVCGGAHTTFEHSPDAKTTFNDGTRHKSTYSNGALAMATDKDSHICIRYNTGACKVNGDHGHGPTRRAHVCGLCLGTHGALSASRECARRTADGRIKL